MREPLRITCPSIASVSAADQLVVLATRDQHVVLQFPVATDAEWHAFDAKAILDRLAPLMSEDMMIFEAAGDKAARCITIKRVISTPSVLEHEEAIHAAAVAFRNIATSLMSQLAEKLGLPLKAFADDALIRFQLGDRGRGELDQGWEYCFHGFERRLVNRLTGQEVEVSLDFQGEFGVLDPHFFYRFVSTTAGLATAASLFMDSYHDPKRAFEVLARRGRLTWRASVIGGGGWLVAAEQSRLGRSDLFLSNPNVQAGPAGSH
jgi:hypothetical protein